MGLSRTILAEECAVASEHPLASLAGYDVLRAGGNAFDAAVATSYSLAVAFHPAGGLGGDFFGMFYEAKSGKVLCLNSSGWAPSGLDLALIDSRAGGKVPQFGPMSVSVPGMVAGVSSMHSKLGSMEFRGLLASAQRLAKDGFPASPALCRSVALNYDGLSAEARKVFAPSGKPTSPGETVRQPALAEVISAVAEGGPSAFYSGPPAESISATLSSLGVSCPPSDFRDFSPEWVDPLTLDYRGTTVYEVPPNSMGATSLLILHALLREDLSRHGALSPERARLTADAALLAYGRRDQLLGDPRFTDFDLDDFLSSGADSPQPTTRVRSGDTTAFSIADKGGNMVSGIQSLFSHFGSRVFVPDCGIALNNRASGFSTSGPNSVGPRKRPLHTLSSLILERGGAPYLAIGASGGDYRPMQHALFVTNSVDYSMSADANVAHPRVLWTGGRSLIVEEGFGLPAGYDCERLPMPGRTGVCQAVEVRPGYRMGVCDVRGDGVPAGF